MLRNREGLAGKFVMGPVDTSVRFSPAQPSSPGVVAEESGGWMGSSWMPVGEADGRQIDRKSSDRRAVEGTIGPVSLSPGVDREEVYQQGTSRWG